VAYRISDFSVHVDSLTIKKKYIHALLAFSKLRSHAPTEKIHSVKVEWTTVNQTRSQYFDCFIQKNCPQINFNQSVITIESFGSDWIEIKRIQVNFLFD